MLQVEQDFIERLSIIDIIRIIRYDKVQKLLSLFGAQGNNLKKISDSEPKNPNASRSFPEVEKTCHKPVANLADACEIRAGNVISALSPVAT